MALIVLETICVLACGFFLYVLWQWMREGKGTTDRGLTGAVARRWSGDTAPAKVVSFRRNASRGDRRPSADLSRSPRGRQGVNGVRTDFKRWERIAHERIAKASAAWK
jgi:hypothetical protein